MSVTQAGHRVHRQPARAERSGRRDVPADADRCRDADAQPPGRDQYRREVRRPQVRLRADERHRARLRLQAEPAGDRDDSPPGVAVGDARHLHEARLAARGPQVADPGQRRLHRRCCRRRCAAICRARFGDRRRARATRLPATTTSWKIARGSRPTSTCSRELQDVFDAANRNNTSIYARRSARAGDRRVRHHRQTSRCSTSQQSLGPAMDTLRSLAENTDGRAIVNRNDLGAAMKQIIRDSSAYYLVGYTHAGAERRQVPRDQGARQAAGRAGPRAPRLLGLHRGRVEARRRRPQARPAGRGDQGAGRDCADDQPALHPHLDRQRQGRRRPHEGDVAVGAAAAHARREARRTASRHGAGDLAVRRHRVSRPRAERAGGVGQRAALVSFERRPASSMCASPSKATARARSISKTAI